MNPRDIVMSILGNNNPMSNVQNIAMQNPMMKQAINMVQSNDVEMMPTVAQNLCRQKGINFNEAANSFRALMNQFGVKVPF